MHFKYYYTIFKIGLFKKPNIEDNNYRKQKMIYNNSSKEFDVQSLLKIFSNYKWLIISTMLIFFISMMTYLFFKPSLYISEAIMEVKIPQEKQRSSDDPLKNIFHHSLLKVEKEIEILKTYKINKNVIQFTNLQTQFFIKKRYKYRELYKKDIPLKLIYTNVSETLINKMIKLTPNGETFKLEIQYSLQERLKSKLNNRVLFQFDNKTLFNFGEHIRTNLIEIMIEKNKTITEPIYLRFTGSMHDIYSNMVNKNLNIEQLKINTPLIKVSYVDTIPERATEYVNELLKTFLQNNINNKVKTNNSVLDFIQTQIDKTQKKISVSEKSLEEYKINKELLNPSLQSNITIKQLSDIEVKIFENGLKKRLINNALKMLNKGESISSIGPALVELNDKATISLIETLNQLELKENRLSQEYTEEFHELRQTRIDISNIQRKIKLNIKSLSTSIYNQERTLKKMKKSYEKSLKSLPKEETKLVNLKRDHDVYSKMFAYLLEKKAENNMLKVANISDYTIIEKAYIPSSPFKPRRGLLLTIATFLGFLAGLFIAILHHKLHKKITSIDDIQTFDELNIYGQLPSLKKDIKRFEVLRNPNSLYNKCLRKIHRDLELLHSNQKSKIVLITSMEKQEGKSTIVHNLGGILQQTQAKSILIDFNFKNPSLNNYFKISSQQGLQQYLRGEETLDKSIASTNFLNLDILPAGNSSSSFSESLLSETKLDKLFIELKKEYDYIIIDSNSIQEASETITLMKHADLNLIVLRKNHSKRSVTSLVREVIKKYHIENSGLILNEFDIDDNCI